MCLILVKPKINYIFDNIINKMLNRIPAKLTKMNNMISLASLNI